MKTKQPYLKGKSVFVVSLLVVGVTILTVYLTGINYNRSLHLSLGIIATALFLSMAYGLYNGMTGWQFPEIPKFPNRRFNRKSASPAIDMPSIDVGDGIGGLILSILLWVVISILFVVLLIVLEAIFRFSLGH